MKIALINASPKTGRSASASLLADLSAFLSGSASLVEIGLHDATLPGQFLQEPGDIDVLVFACPLYVDGLPGHLLSCLLQLEQAFVTGPVPAVYGIVNCGFYEGIQAETALELFENWCRKAGLVWGGGIGVGGGGGLDQMPSSKNGPKAPVLHALEQLAGEILQKESPQNHYVSVAFPRFLYKLAALMGWRRSIRANGASPKDLGRTPSAPTPYPPA